MDAKSVQLEKDLILLKSQIDIALLEAYEQDFSPRMRELRDRVFLSHSRAEGFIDLSLLILHFEAALPNSEAEKIASEEQFDAFLNIFEPTMRGLSFMRKLDLLKNYGNLDQSLYSKIRSLNELRVAFAHPREKKYKDYEEDDAYKNALKDILETLTAIHESMKKPMKITIRLSKKSS